MEHLKNRRDILELKVRAEKDRLRQLGLSTAEHTKEEGKLLDTYQSQLQEVVDRLFDLDMTTLDSELVIGSKKAEFKDNDVLLECPRSSTTSPGNKGSSRNPHRRSSNGRRKRSRSRGESRAGGKETPQETLPVVEYGFAETEEWLNQKDGSEEVKVGRKREEDSRHRPTTRECLLQLQAIVDDCKKRKKSCSKKSINNKTLSGALPATVRGPGGELVFADEFFEGILMHPCARVFPTSTSCSKKFRSACRWRNFPFIACLRGIKKGGGVCSFSDCTDYHLTRKEMEAFSSGQVSEEIIAKFQQIQPTGWKRPTNGGDDSGGSGGVITTTTTSQGGSSRHNSIREETAASSSCVLGKKGNNTKAPGGGGAPPMPVIKWHPCDRLYRSEGGCNQGVSCRYRHFPFIACLQMVKTGICTFRGQCNGIHMTSAEVEEFKGIRTTGVCDATMQRYTQLQVTWDLTAGNLSSREEAPASGVPKADHPDYMPPPPSSSNMWVSSTIPSGTKESLMLSTQTPGGDGGGVRQQELGVESTSSPSLASFLPSTAKPKNTFYVDGIPRCSDGCVISEGILRSTFDRHGTVISVVVLPSGHEALVEMTTAEAVACIMFTEIEIAGHSLRISYYD